MFLYHFVCKIVEELPEREQLEEKTLKMGYNVQIYLCLQYST